MAVYAVYGHAPWSAHWELVGQFDSQEEANQRAADVVRDAPTPSRVAAPATVITTEPTVTPAAALAPSVAATGAPATVVADGVGATNEGAVIAAGPTIRVEPVEHEDHSAHRADGRGPTIRVERHDDHGHAHDAGDYREALVAWFSGDDAIERLLPEDHVVPVTARFVRHSEVIDLGGHQMGFAR